jgi:hypothetical protein
MDTERLEALESQIIRLIQAFTQVKEDNTRLTQSLLQCQQALHEPHHSLERWQSAQEELVSLRTVIQTLQQERKLIRARLEEMLAAIERLEAFSHVPSDS